MNDDIYSQTMSEARGIRNNNPLNIVKGCNWKGERPVQKDKVFEEFESMQMGLRAGIKLIKNHINGFNGRRRPCNTIRKLIYTWAPPNENDTPAYIATVCRHTGLSQYEIIHSGDRRNIIAIARAMAYVECGVWLEPELFESAYDLL